MEMSKHAKTRSKQRGIPYNCIELIMRFGTPKRKPGNVLEYTLGRKDKQKAQKYLKHLLQRLDTADSKAVLVLEDSQQVVTVYNLHKKH